MGLSTHRETHTAPWSFNSTTLSQILLFLEVQVIRNTNTSPNKMKSFQQILLLFVAAMACVSGFAPVSTPRSVKSLSMSKTPEPLDFAKEDKKAAAVAAFATAMAPFAAHADTAVDEATLIGYGAGLVACVVSLAVGFAIGYGTLAKL